jgi:hypothetical protein
VQVWDDLNFKYITPNGGVHPYLEVWRCPRSALLTTYPSAGRRLHRQGSEIRTMILCRLTQRSTSNRPPTPAWAR